RIAKMLAREANQARRIQFTVQADARLRDGLVELERQRGTDAAETVAGRLLENLPATRLRIEEHIGRADPETNGPETIHLRRVGEEFAAAIGQVDPLHIEPAFQPTSAGRIEVGEGTGALAGHLTIIQPYITGTVSEAIAQANKRATRPIQRSHRQRNVIA